MNTKITIIEHADVGLDDVEKYMLTTLDNPYNPFVQWDDWQAFDASQGYYTLSYLARIAKTSNDISVSDQTLAINQAINEIIRFDLLGIYVKVTNKTFKDRSKEVIFPTVTVVPT